MCRQYSSFCYCKRSFDSTDWSFSATAGVWLWPGETFKAEERPWWQWCLQWRGRGWGWWSAQEAGPAPIFSQGKVKGIYRLRVAAIHQELQKVCSPSHKVSFSKQVWCYSDEIRWTTTFSICIFRVISSSSCILKFIQLLQIIICSFWLMKLGLKSWLLLARMSTFFHIDVIFGCPCIFLITIFVEKRYCEWIVAGNESQWLNKCSTMMWLWEEDKKKSSVFMG